MEANFPSFSLPPAAGVCGPTHSGGGGGGGGLSSAMRTNGDLLLRLRERRGERDRDLDRDLERPLEYDLL